jgi:hypothetical protein
MYAVPPYNLFRVLVRHSMFLALGISVLSACALARIRSASAEPVAIRRVYSWASIAIAASFFAAATVVVRRGCGDLSGAGLVTSLLVLSGSIIVLDLWARGPRSRLRDTALVACIAVDLLTFDGWGASEPHYSGRRLAAPTEFTAPKGTGEIASELAANHQRMWAVNGVLGGTRRTQRYGRHGQESQRDGQAHARSSSSPR